MTPVRRINRPGLALIVLGASLLMPTLCRQAAAGANPQDPDICSGYPGVPSKNGPNNTPACISAPDKWNRP